MKEISRGSHEIRDFSGFMRINGRRFYNALPRKMIDFPGQEDNLAFHDELRCNRCVVYPLIEPAATFPPGCKCGAENLRVVTSNDLYFAYASSCEVRVFNAATKELVRLISGHGRTVLTIKLGTRKSRWLAVVFRSGSECATMFFDLENQRDVGEFVSSELIVSLTWVDLNSTCVAFKASLGALLFCNPEVDRQWSSIIAPFSPMAVTYAVDLKEHVVLAGADKTGHLHRFDFTNVKIDTFDSGRKHVVSMTGDPFNPVNCLVCWREGQWGLFDVSNGLTMISQCVVSGGGEFAGAVWLRHPPGMFIIGMANTGILKLWTTTGDRPIESVTLHEAGVAQMEILKNQELLIAFTDGRIVAYSWKTKTVTWEIVGGHTKAVSGVVFVEECVVTTSIDGSICIWDTESMARVDRLVGTEPISCADYLEISRSLVCGTYTGSLQLFSIKDRLMTKSYKNVLKSKIVRLLTDCVSGIDSVFAMGASSECVVLSLPYGEVLWSLPETTGVTDAALARDKIVLSCKDGSVIWADFAEDSDFKKVQLLPTGESILAISSWKPTSDYIVVSTSDQRILRFEQDGSQSLEVKTPIPFDWLNCLSAYRIVGGKRGSETFILGATELSTFHTLSKEISQCATCFEKRHGMMEDLSVSGSSGGTVNVWITDYARRKRFTLRHETLPSFEGTREFFELLCMMTGISTEREEMGDREIPVDIEHRPHIRDILQASERKTLEMTFNLNADGPILKQAIISKKRIVAAAHLEILSGRIEHGCDLLFAAGEHDKALAIAPAVSYEYWQQMMRDRAFICQTPAGRARSLFLCGDYDSATEVLAHAELFSSAFLIAATKRVKKPLAVKEVRSREAKQLGPLLLFDEDFNSNDSYCMYLVAKSEASQHLSQHKIYRAASAFLSIGDINSAFQILFQNGEFEAAWNLDQGFQMKNEKIGLYSMRNMQKYNFSVASLNELARMFRNRPESLKWKFVPMIRFASQEQLDQFFEVIELPKPKTLVSDKLGPPIIQKMYHLCLDCDHSNAIDIGLQELKVQFKQPMWDFKYCQAICRFLELIWSEVRLVRREVMVVSYYLGAYEAMWNGHRDAFDEMIRIAISVCRSENFEFMLGLLTALRDHAVISPRPGVVVNPPTAWPTETCVFEENFTMPRPLALRIFNVSPFLPDGSGDQWIVW